MTEIPEHHLKRVEAAHEKYVSPDHSSSIHGDVKSADQLPYDVEPAEATELSDVAELAGIIDIGSPEVCNLAAVAIRHSLKRNIQNIGARSVTGFSYHPGINTKKSYGKNRIKERSVLLSGFEGHREIVDSVDGSLSVVDYNMRRWLVGQSFQDVDSEKVALVTWASGEVKHIRHFFADRITHIGLNQLDVIPLTIGVMSTSANGVKPLFVPFLQSVKTLDGCHLIYPDGREIDDKAFNKPAILNITMELVKDRGPDGLAFNDSVQALAAIGRNTNDPGFHSKLSAILPLSTENPKFQLERSILAMHLVAASSNRPLPYINNKIIGTTKSIDTVIANGNHKLIYFLEKNDWIKSTDGFFRTEYIIYGTVDPNVYGHEEADRNKSARFRITIDELYNVRLEALALDGITGEECTEEDRSSINKIMLLMDD